MNITSEELNKIITNIDQGYDESKDKNLETCWEFNPSPFEKHIINEIKKFISQKMFQKAINMTILIMNEKSKYEILGNLLCDYAINNNKDACIVLMKIGADVMYKQYRPFIEACSNNNINIVKVMIEAGVKPSSVPSSLIVSIVNNHATIVTELIESGVSPNINNGEPLRICCINGLYNIAHTLISLGADVNLKGNKFILLALQHERIDLVKLLIENGYELVENREKCMQLVNEKGLDEIRDMLNKEIDD